MIIPFTNNVLFFFVEYNYNKIHAVMEVMYFYSWGQKFFMIPFLLLGAIPHAVSLTRLGHCSPKLLLWNPILLKFGFSWSTLKWIFWNPRENCTDTDGHLRIWWSKINCLWSICFNMCESTQCMNSYMILSNIVKVLLIKLSLKRCLSRI